MWRSRANGFLLGQILLCINVFAAPLALAGWCAFLRDRRYRTCLDVPHSSRTFLHWKGTERYMAGLSHAAGHGRAAGERWLLPSQARPAHRHRCLFAASSSRRLHVPDSAFLHRALLTCPATQWRPARGVRLGTNVKTVAGIRDSLPPEERRASAVLVGNYGEQGAIESWVRPPSAHAHQP